MRFIVNITEENENNGCVFAGCLLEAVVFLAIIGFVGYLIRDVAKQFFSNFNAVKLIGLIIFIIGSIFIFVNEFIKYKNSK